MINYDIYNIFKSDILSNTGLTVRVGSPVSAYDTTHEDVHNGVVTYARNVEGHNIMATCYHVSYSIANEYMVSNFPFAAVISTPIRSTSENEIVVKEDCAVFTSALPCDNLIDFNVSIVEAMGYDDDLINKCLCYDINDYETKLENCNEFKLFNERTSLIDEFIFNVGGKKYENISLKHPNALSEMFLHYIDFYFNDDVDVKMVKITDDIEVPKVEVDIISPGEYNSLNDEVGCYLIVSPYGIYSLGSRPFKDATLVPYVVDVSQLRVECFEIKLDTLPAVRGWSGSPVILLTNENGKLKAKLVGSVSMGILAKKTLYVSKVSTISNAITYKHYDTRLNIII